MPKYKILFILVMIVVFFVGSFTYSALAKQNSSDTSHSQWFSDIHSRCDEYGNRIYYSFSGAGASSSQNIFVLKDDCEG